jgi:flagellar basal-body rod modification protein FlgD
MATSPVTASPINMQDFLRILVAQLNNQDPLKPMDNQEFVTQMAQFTSLQQTQILNDNMEKLLTTQGSMQSVGLLGKNVDVTTDGGNVSGQVTALQFVNGEPRLTVTQSNGTPLTGVSLSSLLLVR